MSITGVASRFGRWVCAGALLLVATSHGMAAQALVPPASSGSGLRPELALQLGHRDAVLSVAFSPDGGRLASGGADCTLRIWDLRTETLLRTDEEQVPVSFVAFLPDGNTVAARTHWNQISLMDAQTSANRGACLFTDHKASVAAISPNGALGVGGSDNGHFTVSSSQVNDYRVCDAAHRPLRAAAFSPDGALLALGAGDGAVRIWNVRRAAFEPGILRHDGPVRALAFSPDGSILAAGGGGRGGKVKLWGLPSCRLNGALEGGVGPVTSVAFSPDGRSLAAGSLRPARRDANVERDTVGQVDVWDLPAGRLRCALPVPTGGVRTVAFSPDGRSLAAGGDEAAIRLWGAQTGVPRGTLAGYGGSIRSLSLSPDGRTLASGCDDGRVRLWSAQTAELLQGWRAHPGPALAVAFSPDGERMATGGEDRVARMWDASTGALRSTLGRHAEHVWSLAYSPDGKMLATGSLREIRLWDARTGKRRCVLKGHPDYVSSLAFSPDGRMLLSGSRNRRDPEREDEELLLWDVAGCRRRGELHPGGPWVRSLRFSPDGATLAIGTDSVQLWDTATWQRRAVLPGTRGEAAAFSPDGRMLATPVAGGQMITAGVDVWDAGTGARLKALRGHGHVIRSLLFLPDSRRLVGGSDDATLRIWDAMAGRPLATLFAAPTDPPPALPEGARPLGADSKPIDAGGSEGAPACENYLVVTPEGYYAGPAGADRQVRFRLGDGLFPAECFQARYYRPHLVRRALQGEPPPPVGEFHGAYPPLAGIVSPRDGDAVQGESVNVTVRASDDSRVERVEIIANGRRVDGKPIGADSKPLPADSKPVLFSGVGEIRAHTTQQEVTVAVPLPPDEKTIQLEVVAYDDDGLQSPRARISITRESAAARKGRLLALCVGVSRHLDRRLDLKYADADAHALADLLGRQRGIYDGAQADLLVNEKATLRGIQGSLQALLGMATHSDTVVLFLSGHGWRSGEGQFCFAPYDVDRGDMAHTGLPWKEVVQQLRALSARSRQVIVLLDACHSGTAGAATSDELVQAVLQANAGVRVLASSRGSEWSQELASLGHGAFTQALLEGLQGKASADRRTVTLAGLVVYVATRVRKLTGDRQHPYIPLLHDFDPATVVATVGR